MKIQISSSHCAKPETYYANLARRINSDLEKAVSVDFPESLYDPMSYVLSTYGKRFRPILLIMACESVGGTQRSAYNAALAIEILHNFTLVHDDIMDNDDLRRGKETVHKKWNSNIAILAGDGLIALAYRYLLKTHSRQLKQIIQIFSEAIIKICEGQSVDKDMESVPSVSMDEYLDMIERKTGILVSISAEIGGIIGSGASAAVEALRKYGLELGTAFQIQDDLFDIISEEAILGKDIGSDLCNGKKTYPIILFMQRATARDKKRLLTAFSACRGDAAIVHTVCDMMNAYGIISDVKHDVDRRIQTANSFLFNHPDGISLNGLLYLSEMIRTRTH